MRTKSHPSFVESTTARLTRTARRLGYRVHRTRRMTGRGAATDGLFLLLVRRDVRLVLRVCARPLPADSRRPLRLVEVAPGRWSVEEAEGVLRMPWLVSRSVAQAAGAVPRDRHPDSRLTPRLALLRRSLPPERIARYRRASRSERRRLALTTARELGVTPAEARKALAG